MSVAFNDALWAWRDYANLRLCLDVWRFHDGYGRPRATAVLVAMHDGVILAGANVRVAP